ncbi:hypothetical protein [Roseovarius sp.]|uniref:hypothetical protein n=1 Tax=Roseovarius sp. TaxID=1486281 RepID=UPI003BA84272
MTALDRHQTKTGTIRKELDRLLRKAGEIHAKCETDSDKAAVFDALMAKAREIREGQ